MFMAGEKVSFMAFRGIYGVSNIDNLEVRIDMIIRYPIGSSVFLVLAGILVLLNGCATSAPKVRVQTGEEVKIHYTCRLKSGEIVATTDKGVAEDSSLPKSRLFVPPNDDEVPALVAGSGKGGPAGMGKLEPFESEIGARLTNAVAGLEFGKEYTVEVASEMQLGLTKEDRFLTLSRIRRNKPKEHRMTWEEYRDAYGKEPAVGQEAFSVGPVTGEVVSVEDSDVVVGLFIQEGGSIDMQFGKAVYHDKGDHFDIVIDAHVGDLVRTGWLVGRVVSVDDRILTIDFGHPFGGETLMCDVLVAPVEETSEEKTGE